ncbi:DNA repair protein RadA [Candidatus Microgenomates bacterium]|nr:DNA repair protein RadA [Candidatus Microgenomates bacterium]
MAKSDSVYVCQQCGNEYSKWFGKCSSCGEWNSLVESVRFTRNNKSKSSSSESFEDIKPVKLTQVPASKTARIRTKLPELDRALGGGLVPGQVVLLAGEPGIGKCVVADTYIPTGDGLKTIKSLQPSNTQTGFTEQQIVVQSINGIDIASHFYKSDLQPTKSLRTRMGYSLQATYEHPVYTLTSAGKKSWKTMDELEVGDYIAIQRHGAIWGKEVALSPFIFEIRTNATTPNFPNKIDKDMAYCLGLLIGDGGLTDFGNVNLTTVDKTIELFFTQWITSLDLKVKRTHDRYGVYSRIFHLWLNHIGVASTRAENKSIPKLILEAPKHIVKSFLQGLFDTDGSANVNSKGSMPGAVEYCSTSKLLATQVHLLLLQFGIVGKLRYKSNYRLGAWVIGLLGNNARLFYKNIGFRLTRKQFGETLLPNNNNNNIDLIPYLPKIDPSRIPNTHRWDRRYLKGTRAASYEKLASIAKFIPEIKDLLEPRFYWDRVDKLNKAKKMKCYDLCVPNSHSFVTNGIVSHNSTILLQLADTLKNVLYVSGEESVAQVALRAKRLGVKNKLIDFLETTNVDHVIQTIKNSKGHDIIIVDSIQTMATTDLTGLTGSVGQIKECTFRLLHEAKSKNIPLILVGHVTKQGSVAGPAVLAHMVDTVLWFEGDKSLTLRLLRAVKNRFGATDEVGIFTMEETGLVSLVDPEKVFLEKADKAVSGSVVTALLEGTRPILVEIQSLVVPTKLAFPRRVAQGIDSKRLEMLLAVLTRRVGLNMYDMDVFVNVAGGIKATDPSVDLAVCMSLASSFYDLPAPSKLIAVGEVGLLGEIRKVAQSEKRTKEAKRIGYNIVVDGTKYKTLREAIKKYFK